MIFRTVYVSPGEYSSPRTLGLPARTVENRGSNRIGPIGVLVVEVQGQEGILCSDCNPIRVASSSSFVQGEAEIVGRRVGSDLF